MIWLHASLVTKSSQDFVLPQWINQLNFSCSYFKLLFFSFAKFLNLLPKPLLAEFFGAFHKIVCCKAPLAKFFLPKSSCKFFFLPNLLSGENSFFQTSSCKFFFLPNLLWKKNSFFQTSSWIFFLSSKPPLANFSFFQISLQKSMRVFNLAMISWVL